ncbi:beta-N-acetylglucosaminidase domain-containing protein [uncultured Bacteroides sp.]|uniref:beta-N-acetylglucosaminidase domain-containing protein n=1 Tax=uncultured Bacteroides sp. TaxID=162156 RepID=UPI0025D5B9A0|nr:beta-N-acetylglucosaminidase domain-containing protein [uncultured Bacteroides sp.]
MINYKKTLALLAVTLFTGGNLVAQEQDIDLNTQRSESQDIRIVPGKVTDHKGLIINPTPHNIKLVEGSELDISKGINLKDMQGKFSTDLGLANLSKRGTKLTIDFGKKVSLKSGVKSISGAYSINIDGKGISIIGYDEKGAFYGIQTLRQIMKSPVSANSKLPHLNINDYPDLPYRGVVEGFYGTPWSHQVRLSLIDFYGQFKMNYYLYGPKDDPYHSCPNWRLPYPEKEAESIKELVTACNRNRVDFVWAIHPGQDIKWNDADYDNLVHKFNLMYDLGVRSFAIFFDDIEGEGTNPMKQTELLNRLNKDFVKTKGDVAPLIVCPTDYSKLWANPTPQGSLCIYGNNLNPSINVFWTGDVVCSDLTKETMDWVNSRIKRPALYWWNFPVTDYARHIIMQGPAYGLDTSLTSNDLCGLISNPMEHGEASKLALYGVADYAWNIAEYNPIDNWERGIAELTPEAKEAYRTFAIHSCDTETGYRRAESWETETFRIDNYTKEEFNNLQREFDKIEKTPAEMEEKCANKILLSELRPWLVEFGKLGTRGKQALDLIELYTKADNATFWAAYINNLMTKEDRKAFNAHKSGTMKMQSFYENTMDDLLRKFYTKLTGKLPLSYKAIGSFNNLSTIQGKLMFDNDSTTFYTSGTSQNNQSWIGTDLGCTKEITEISILQGRNSVDDVDYFDNALVEYSEDGKSWIALTDSLKKQYVINWNGTPVKARYVRLKKLPSTKSNWVAIRSFEINPLKVEKLNFCVEADDLGKALFAFDKNPLTSYANSGALSFTLTEKASGCTLLLKPNSSKGPLKLLQYASDNKLLAETTINTPFVKVDFKKGTEKITIDGAVEIFEIIF